MGKALALPILSFDKITKFKVCEGRPLSKNKFVTIDIQISTLWSELSNIVHKIMLPFTLYFYYTVNIYRYKAIGANATSSVILYTGKYISPCLEIL